MTQVIGIDLNSIVDDWGIETKQKCEWILRRNLLKTPFSVAKKIKIFHISARIKVKIMLLK